MAELPDPIHDDKTIFTSTELNSEEREAVRKGEARGKKVAEMENPERYGLARQRAIADRISRGGGTLPHTPGVRVKFHKQYGWKGHE